MLYHTDYSHINRGNKYWYYLIIFVDCSQFICTEIQRNGYSGHVVKTEVTSFLFNSTNFLNNFRCVITGMPKLVGGGRVSQQKQWTCVCFCLSNKLLLFILMTIGLASNIECIHSSTAGMPFRKVHAVVNSLDVFVVIIINMYK